ncbi:hypothetical protein GIB67_035079 [Kingdonia uniflora]|uniref:Uncharacterized protein n=1 Tax=Kingdonia uniflora TaxID=39325 RepID=A0A7J7L1K4_9MAGN|nr:hypothetical protein GIB67_035079 [Kingdonia uniflora]
MHWPIGIYFATLLTWFRSVQILMIPVIIQKKFSCMKASWREWYFSAGTTTF